MTRISSLISIVAIVCGVALAQKEEGNSFYAVTVGKGPAEGLATAITTARFGLMGPTVKGAPYAADGVTETTQTLGDGTHINRQETYTIYRDGEGRVRRESGDQIWISDPVANVSYVLDTKQQTARKLSLSRDVAFSKMQVSDHLAKVKAEAAAGPIWFQSGTMAGGAVTGPMVVSDGVGGTAGQGKPEIKNESLGKQQMEGVEVDGSRITTVIPVGQIGNDRPLQMVHERWESTDLHVTILAKHTDPLMGDRVERLTNVRRGEPDPALFQVPAGSYTIEVDK